MLIVKSLDELSLYSGADQVAAYRQEQGFAEYAFLYACVVPDRGHEAIHATFQQAIRGTGRRTVNISAVHQGDGKWVCRHIVEIAAASAT